MRDDLALHLEMYGENDTRVKQANAYGHRKPYAEFMHHNDDKEESDHEGTESD